MSQLISIYLPFESETIQFGSHMATCLKAPLVIGFCGDIGAGKTTLIRSMLRALGITSAIKSPTFSLVESYELDRFLIHHFDLYRIQDVDELEHIGMRDYLSNDTICCIEWPEHGEGLLKQMDLVLTLKARDAGRELEIKAHSSAGQGILTCMDAWI